jgi:hypothetical protein
MTEAHKAVTAAAVSCLAITMVTVATFSLRRQSAGKPVGESALRLSNKASSVPPSITKLCFVRGNWIYLRDLASGKESKVIEGKSPSLSPIGDALAFMSPNAGSLLANLLPPTDQITGHMKVVNLRTKSSQLSGTFAKVRAYGPQWSGDGRRIAFEVTNDDASRLDIGVVDWPNGEWRRITSDLNLGKAEPIYLDSWVPGDKSILFHTLENLYEVGVDGRLLRQTPIENICDRSEVSSNTRFSLSANKRFLLFDRTIAPEDMYISVFDFDHKKLLRVTPLSVAGTNPVWITSEEILFTCAEKGEGPLRHDICKIAVDGTALTTVVVDGDYASFAKK